MDARLKKLLDQSSCAVFFGGAGVSTESGIPDFRSDDGIYRAKYAYPPETILSHSFFMKHTEEFFKFYWDKMIYRDAKPNSCHMRLAELEKTGKLLGVVTQNIDGLHQLAGSKRVCELHGSVKRNYCMNCGRLYGLDELKFRTVPKCDCGGIIKPDVVLYEEPLDSRVMEEAVKMISKAELMIIGGTSLNVYPAAGLLNYFNGADIVVINKAPTPVDLSATLVINESIARVFGYTGV